MAILILLALTAGMPAAVAKELPRADLDQTMAYLAGRAGDDAALGDLLPYFVEAAVAAGLDPAAWPPGNESILARLERYEPSTANIIYQLRPAHALAAAGVLGPDDARTGRLLASYSEGQFGDASRVNDDIWALMTLPLAGVTKEDARLQGSASEVLGYQDRSGGWSWQAVGSPETDTTGMALEGLAAVGRLEPTVADQALGFITDQTHASGGVSIVKPAGANCNSTVWAVRGHVAAGYDAPPRAWSYLADLRNTDGSYDLDNTVDGGDLLCTLEVATLLGTAVRNGWNMHDDEAPVGKPALLEAWASLGAVTLASWVARRRT